jgi:hypothetical protein
MSIKALFDAYFAKFNIGDDSRQRSIILGLFPLINDLIDNDSNYKKHNAVKDYILKHKLFCSEFDTYMNEFEEFMYTINEYDSKIWKNEKNEVHRTTKDDSGMTKPAMIRKDGGMVWMKNGKYFRNDRDQFGHLMPTEIEGTGKMFWNLENTQHRAELCNDPSDIENFGKALPAIIRADGTKVYKYKNNNMTQDEVTNKILEKQKRNTEPDLSNLTDITAIEITLDDGSTIKLTSGIKKVSLCS